MNVFDADIERVQVMKPYTPAAPGRIRRPRVFDPPVPRRRGAGRKRVGRPPLPLKLKRRRQIKIWLTDAEFKAIRGIENKSAVGRAALLAAATKTTKGIEMLKITNQILGCTPKQGVVSKAVAYCYAPFAPGVVNPHAPNASMNSIEINGQQVERSADRPVLLYHAGDKPGQWELLADVSEAYFIESFDYVE